MFFQEGNKNMLLPKASSCDRCDFNYIFLALSEALNQKIHLIRNKNKQTIPQKMSLNATQEREREREREAKSMKKESF